MTISTLLIFLIIPLVSSAINRPSVVSEPVFEQGTDVLLSVPCTSNGVYCSVNTTCSATIINPEHIVLVNNGVMSQNNAVFELPLNSSQTSTNGEYEFNIVCSDGINSNSRNLVFYITPNGELPTSAKGMLYLGLLVIFVIVMLLAIYGGFNVSHIALKTGLYLGAYLLLIAITFISWNLSLDYLTSSPFLTSFFRITWIVLMVGLFPLVLVMTIYTFWMLRTMDVINNMIDKGMPVDEAYERVVRGGLKTKW